MVASTTRKFFCLFSLGTQSQELFLENICTNFVYKGLRHEMKQKNPEEISETCEIWDSS